MTARHYPGHDCPIYAAFRDGAVHKIDNEVFWRKDGSQSMGRIHLHPDPRPQPWWSAR